MRLAVSRIQKGNILLCYLTGVMRWVGVLEFEKPSQDKSQIWKDTEFPIRLSVKPLIMLRPEHGIPLESLEGKLDYYAGARHRGKFKGFLRASPAPFRRQTDGDLVFSLPKEAKQRPVNRAVDAKKPVRKPLFKAGRRREEPRWKP